MIRCYLTKRLFLCVIILLGIITPVVSQDLYVVIASSLNVRSDASQQAPIIGKVTKGDTVYVNRITENWAEIPFGLRMGYVSMAYIKQVNNTNEVIEDSSNAKLTFDSNTDLPYMKAVGDGTYALGDRILSVDECYTYFDEYCPEAYNKLVVEMTKGYKIGKAGSMVFMIAGLPAVGMITAGALVWEDGKKAGPPVTLVGVGLLVASGAVFGICWGVNHSREKSTYYVDQCLPTYNSSCARRRAARAQMTKDPVEFCVNVVPNGVGFSMRF